MEDQGGVVPTQDAAQVGDLIRICDAVILEFSEQMVNGSPAREVSRPPVRELGTYPFEPSLKPLLRLVSPSLARVMLEHDLTGPPDEISGGAPGHSRHLLKLREMGGQRRLIRAPRYEPLVLDVGKHFSARLPIK